MKRRWRALLALLILTAFAVWLEPTRVVWGWLRGEAFYEGRPTRYWRNEITQWEVTSRESGGFVQDDGMVHANDGYERSLSHIEAFFSRWIGPQEKPWPQLFDGDIDGKAVLTELSTDPSAHVQLWAIEGLRRIETGEKGPRRSYRSKSPF